MFFRLASLLCFLFLFQSCVSAQAHWQKKEYQPKKMAVLYYNPKPSFFDKTAVQQRIQDAQQKMRSFCSPKKAQIISEKKEEQVIGRQTHFNATEDNPNPNYYEKIRENHKGFYEKTAQMLSQSVLSSSGSQIEQDIVRERVYVTFTCK